MAALRAPGNRRYLSIVSVWELQIKVSSGKLTLPTSVQHFVATYRSANSIYPLSISESHIWALATLPFHHRDPFDRILIAQAITEGWTLVTADALFVDYPVQLLR
jgi:PIN domain nuclease of toxin-antitoxin system